MKSPPSVRAVRQALRLLRLAHSTRRLHALAARVASGVPAEYEISSFEVRSIAPAILARTYRQDVLAPLLDFAPMVPSNLAFLSGLLVAEGPSAGTVEGLNAIARAVHSIRLRWLLPLALRRELLRICDTLEWSALPVEIALPALRAAFRLQRSAGLWRRMLGELTRAEEWQEIRREVSRHPLLAWRSRAALHHMPAKNGSEAVQIAEIIALARCHMGETGRRLARDWLLPLICHSTGRFLPRTLAARRLAEQLDFPAHVSALELAGAMERGIAPKGNDDYSNFRDAFCVATWECLHCAFCEAGILTELERFASEDDRLRFWRHVTPKSE